MNNYYENVIYVPAKDGTWRWNAAEKQQNKSRKKNYIPPRYHPKYAFIVAGVIVAVIVIVLIAIFCTIGSEAPTTDPLKNFRGKLVFLTNDTKLLKFDPKTKSSTLIFETNKSVAAFDVHADQRFYWTELIDATSTRLKSVDNNTLKILIDDARFEPRCMVLDHITENLYVIDEASGNLVVVSIRTGDYTLLTSELVRPQEIVLDPEEGLMFILEQSTSILRVRMDGTEVTKLFSNSGATSLTLDPKRKRLYWINDFVNIESSDYGGSKRKSFFNDTVTIKSLTFLDDRLYWFWPGYGHPSSLLSCKIGANDTCEDYTSYTMTSLGDPKYIKGYSSTHGTLKNPCEVDNGGCQQLCLQASKNMKSCACRMGWQLVPDKRSCREVRDFILYPQGGFVRVKSVDGATDFVWPTPYNVDSIATKPTIDFDYDLKNDDFYWSDDRHIYRMKLRKFDGNWTTILSVNDPDITLQDMAYDWYTGNMYFVQRSKSFFKPHSLMLFNVDRGEAFQKTLYTYGYDPKFGLQACPYAMILHPAKRSMFFTAVENDKRFIHHANMSGNSLHKIDNTLKGFAHEYRFIAVDYAKDRVYWIWDSDRVTVIKHSNFDGSNMKVISIDEVKNAKTIYVHQQWLYISNLTSIWRVHKETGGGVLRITRKVDDDRRGIAGVRVISESVQFGGKDNGCSEANVGCEQFCLNRDGPVCSCKDGMSARGSKCV